MSEDIIRVFRIVEYCGPRSWVERQINNSIHGVKFVGSKKIGYITGTTLGTFPEIVNNNSSDNNDKT